MLRNYKDIQTKYAVAN